MRRVLAYLDSPSAPEPGLPSELLNKVLPAAR
jgi:hypothetical protein